MRLGRGDGLDEIDAEAAQAIALPEQLREPGGLPFLAMTRQFVARLRRRMPGPDTLSGAGFDEEAFRATVEGPGRAFTRACTLAMKAMLAWLQGDAARALAAALAAEEWMRQMRQMRQMHQRPESEDSIVAPKVAFYAHLARAALCPEAEAEARAEHLAAMEAIEVRFAGWAAGCAERFEPRRLLLDAERARLLGDHEAALDGYDQAIAAAERGRFTQVEAIACERAATYHLGRGRARLGRAYLGEACAGFRRWGAPALAEAIEARHPGVDAQAHLEALSTPFLPITDEVAVMPLVGAVDVARSRQMMDAALAGVHQSGARVVIVDVTGATGDPTGFAPFLHRTVLAVRLLGAEVVITGLGPRSSRSLLDLGVDLDALASQGTLQKAVTYAMRRVGKRLGQ
ncbi:Hypothetical protein CAP_8024 [Chondromyces apiculatus DSM 436]|uniref:STAS domain-containing protein n=1 Tax=Chondromyces apiculatus DSM 436 TaxID=1192034 RepID=A0A017SX97_9BACT|nr:Hypothetical protein CAP_8024 [Chondromyces apiculatus DSM 436]